MSVCVCKIYTVGGIVINDNVVDDLFKLLPNWLYIFEDKVRGPLLI